MTAHVVQARRDDGLRATVVRTVPLLYRAGADASIDRPAHVRAGSGLAWTGGALACVQDDASFVALINPRTGACDAVTLPAGEGGLRQFDDGRGNKRFKLDLEGCAAVPDGRGGEMLVAFGSGSTARRESVLLVEGLPHAPRVMVADASAFYAGLREARAFSGSEMNVEGVVWRDGRILLLNRGNGAPVEGREAVDASCEVDWASLRAHLAGEGPPPAPERIVQYRLGEIDGWRLTFTDAAMVGDALLYTATAEASPNAVDDGPVAGSALGVIGRGGEARWTELRMPDGGLFDGKVEGIAPGPRAGTLYVIVDRDDPASPSDLCEVAVDGGWPPC